jgi:predicted PurR-regulated permease PerM
MIPVYLKNAWFRASDPDETEEEAQSGDGSAHDPVARYALVAIAVVLVTAALSLTQAIAMPIVAGLIFGLIFGPLVDRLFRMGMPQGLAAGVIVLAGIALLAVVAGLFAAPFAIWSESLPAVMEALQQRADEILRAMRQIERLFAGAAPVPAPETVVVDAGSPWLSIAATSSSIAGGFLIFVATTYFYLCTRRQMKARALRLCLGASARRTAGQFLSDLEEKVASYFATITLINLGMGAAATLIAFLAGMPFPLFWGLLGFILNYIAFVGPFIMMALMLGYGLVEHADIVAALVPAGAYFLVNLVEGNVVTPLAVGRRLTLNPFLVFVFFVFWLWLWGPIGAFLATPILLVITLSAEAVIRHRRLETEAEAQTGAAATTAPQVPPERLAVAPAR